MKQTAVEWLWRWIMDNPLGSFQDGVNAYEQAKEIEKQQIIDAYRFPNTLVDMSSEQYYNETFKK
jgi:hypothetical protein